MSITLVNTSTPQRITHQSITDAIKSKEFHLFRSTSHMVCCVVMQCGFTVIGESACANPDEFNIELGQRYALEDAERKIGELLAYEQACKLAYGGQYDH